LESGVEQQMRAALTERLSGGQGLTVSEIRDLLGTTRRYAVPLCEYLDRVGFTERRGDLRMLAGKAHDA
jgi:selenocysteine-specific elongation factor